ncbi:MULTISPECIES: AraC family transcriptional regulator [Actinoplanes]|uniref:AraC family transcriptional regulator n=1 Tax=Actinoplanes TaxID=1865 RepID=UPI000697B62E|nr:MULTISPECIES: AraC family transcriptional regulator [Actinoplanes]GLY02866.1 hypothetical protein Acsp01_32450 [Actinoplanes sp. NBRC 101535]
MTSPVVRVHRSDVETTDIAGAHELLSRAYVDHEPRLRPVRAGFRFRSSVAAAGRLTTERLRYRGAVEASAAPFDSVTTTVVRSGWFSVDDGDQHRFGASDAFLVPLGAPLLVCWDTVDLQNIRFPLDAVARLAPRLGVDAADFRFDGPAPVSPAMRRHWVTTVAYAVQAFTGPNPTVQNPLVYASLLNLIASAAVTVFPNTTMRVAYTPGPGRVPPVAVRRAMTYIEAHAADPITVEDVAVAARIGVRGLQAAFARHGDVTPTAYLRRVRLESAHRELQAADRVRGDTVAAIAARWGFGSPGRFSVAYRAAFGRSPNRTLRT